MRSVLRAVGYVWALPNTAVGLLLGLLSFQVPRLERGALAFDGARRGFLWAFRVTGFKAITFGHVMLSTIPLRGTLLAHELAHVRQNEALGPFFLPLYLLLWVVRGYRKHPLEVDASRRAAAATRAEQPGGPA